MHTIEWHQGTDECVSSVGVVSCLSIEEYISRNGKIRAEKVLSFREGESTEDPKPNEAVTRMSILQLNRQETWKDVRDGF